MNWAECYNRANYTFFVKFIVNSSGRPFRTNIGFIVNQPVGFSRELPFEIGTYAFNDDFEVEKLIGTIRLTRTSSGIEAIGGFSAETEGACGRCLDTIKLAVQCCSDLGILQPVVDHDPAPLFRPELTVGRIVEQPFLPPVLGRHAATPPKQNQTAEYADDCLVALCRCRIHDAILLCVPVYLLGGTPRPR